jgi:hypothetical protein
MVKVIQFVAAADALCGNLHAGSAQIAGLIQDSGSCSMRDSTGELE